VTLRFKGGVCLHWNTQKRRCKSTGFGIVGAWGLRGRGGGGDEWGERKLNRALAICQGGGRNEGKTHPEEEKQENNDGGSDRRGRKAV